MEQQEPKLKRKSKQEKKQKSKKEKKEIHFNTKLTFWNLYATNTVAEPKGGEVKRYQIFILCEGIYRYW